MIITDAELEPTPILEKSICDRCGKCAVSCPLGAISKEKTKEIEICGKIMKVAKIDYEKCKECKNGAMKNRFSAKARPDRVAAICNRTCMVCLEEKKAVSNLFENSFRSQSSWSIGGEKSFENRDEANVLGGEFSKSGNRGNRK